MCKSIYCGSCVMITSAYFNRNINISESIINDYGSNTFQVFENFLFSKSSIINHAMERLDELYIFWHTFS